MTRFYNNLERWIVLLLPQSIEKILKSDTAPLLTKLTSPTLA